MVFHNETLIPRSTLIRAKKACNEWRIRHRFTQTLHPLTPKPVNHQL